MCHEDCYMSHSEFVSSHLILLQIIGCRDFMPKKTKTNYKGKLDKFPSTKVYLNVNYLEKGHYELHIIHRNKLIKTTTFKK